MMRTASLLLLLPLACSKVPSDTAPPRVTEAAPPRAEADATPPPPVEPATDASVGLDASVDAAPGASRSAPPKVKVLSIGMHVGGGPFDEETKKPFLRAVEPHYPELARCWAFVAEPKQADVGVDLLIPAAGGRAKVSNPRTSIRDEGFVPCVVTFFESITFEKPSRGGPQALSYSVRFRP